MTFRISELSDSRLPMYRLYGVLMVVLLASCNTDRPADFSSTNAFYFWQTDMANFEWNDSTFHAFQINKLYIRFFDIDWSESANAAVPVSPLNGLYYYPRNIPGAVPVVFITNETFKHLTKEQSVELARQTKRKLMRRLQDFLTYADFQNDDDWWEHNPYTIKSNLDELKKHDSIFYANLQKIKEIQFDCDWTGSTRENYFAFLEEMKKLFPDQAITSTIRLYQYKYPKEAGVPPVKRGMLMCYNAGDVKDVKTVNSIFDKEEIMKYLDASPYPLPLDYALPTFEWALLYREGKLTNILSATDLRENYASNIGAPDGDRTTVKILADFVYGYTHNSIYIRKGDEIRFEQADLEEVQELASWLAVHKNNPDAILSLYHLNTYDFQHHSKEIKAIFDSF